MPLSEREKEKKRAKDQETVDGQTDRQKREKREKGNSRKLDGWIDRAVQTKRLLLYLKLANRIKNARAALDRPGINGSAIPSVRFFSLLLFIGPSFINSIEGFNARKEIERERRGNEEFLIQSGGKKTV